MRARWLMAAGLFVVLVASLGALAWAMLSRPHPASVLNGTWTSMDGDSLLEFKADQDERRGDCTVKWHLTEKWTKYFPPALVEEFKTKVLPSETAPKGWAAITLKYATEHSGRFSSFGGSSGHNVLLPLAGAPFEGAFSIEYIDSNHIEVNYRIFPETIRYQRALRADH